MFILVVILLTEHHLTVEYVLAAYEEKLIQTGEYVFICFQLNLQGTFKRVCKLFKLSSVAITYKSQSSIILTFFAVSSLSFIDINLYCGHLSLL